MGVKLSFSCAPAQDPQQAIDSSRINQCIFNLLGLLSGFVRAPLRQR